MEAIVVLSFFGLLALASLRWACDSRDAFCSPEQRLAAHGFTWPDRTAGGR